MLFHNQSLVTHRPRAVALYCSSAVCLRTKMATYSEDSDLERENEVTETVSGPRRAEITRQQTARSIGGKCGTWGKSDAKNISLHDRVAQFPNENFTV